MKRLWFMAFWFLTFGSENSWAIALDITIDPFGHVVLDSRSSQTFIELLLGFEEGKQESFVNVRAIGESQQSVFEIVGIEVSASSPVYQILDHRVLLEAALNAKAQLIAQLSDSMNVIDIVIPLETGHICLQCRLIDQTV